MTQKDLADRAGISQSKLSKFENSLMEVPPSDLARLATELEYPPSFFSLTDRIYGFGSACNYNRKRTTVSAKDLHRMLAELNIVRMRLTRLLRSVDVEAVNPFFSIEPDEYERDIERIAGLVRAQWRLPLGPIANLVAVIESAGGMIFKVPFGTAKIDALSQWAPGNPPVIFVNSKIPADRARHSLAHELGHLVLHALPAPEMEQEADRFAAEFLMPAREIGPELGRLTLPRLVELKARWKVSMQSLVYRAHALGKISKDEYSSWFRKFSRLGYRRHEPTTIPDETPSLVFEVVDAVVQSGAIGSSELASMLHSLGRDLPGRFVQNASHLRIVRPL